jgi:hypothetical protein
MINVAALMKYEEGTLSFRDTVKLFSGLIKSGDVWKLQGHYGRTATFLMENGFIDTDGQIDWPLVEVTEEEAGV